MNKIYKEKKCDVGEKKKKKFKNKSRNKNKVMKYLLRINDKTSEYFLERMDFLEEQKGGDFLGIINKDIIILFINKNNKIINYVINNNSKEFIQTEMEFTEFKKLILNEDFKQFDKTLSFSRNFLYKYEIDLMNDVNDWLNGQISEKKYYKLLFTSQMK